MALFRFHRGSLEASLKTTIVIKSLGQLELVVKTHLKDTFFINNDFDLTLNIKPFPNSENNFDARIGWYTHMVIASGNNITEHPVGFLSEHLEK